MFLAWLKVRKNLFFPISRFIVNTISAFDNADAEFCLCSIKYAEIFILILHIYLQSTDIFRKI